MDYLNRRLLHLSSEALFSPKVLTQPSPEAQRLRRLLLSGANLLIVQGGTTNEKEFIYERLRELGVNTYLLDDPNSEWRKPAADGMFKAFLEFDLSNEANLEHRIASACAQAGVYVEFDAVTTFYEDAVAITPRIAEALRLPCDPVHAFDNARSKLRTRKAMEAAGLPVPRYRNIKSKYDLEEAFNDVGFPAVLKPAFGTASIATTKVDCAKAAHDSYNRLSKILDATKDPLWEQGTEMVFEQYYDGDEFDIDVLLWKGKAVYAKVIDNWGYLEPWFQETGLSCPSTYPQVKQEEMIKLAVDSALAMGFKFGCYHVECRYTSEGARLIEVNGRMGGGPIRDLHMNAWGVDFVEEHVMSTLRIPIRPICAASPLQHMVSFLLIAPYSGVVNADSWVDFANKDARVIEVIYHKRKGERVIGPEDGVPEWVAELIIVSSKQKGALELVRQVVADIETIPITPTREGAKGEFFVPVHDHPFSE